MDARQRAREARRRPAISAAPCGSAPIRPTLTPRQPGRRRSMAARPRSPSATATATRSTPPIKRPARAARPALLRHVARRRAAGDRRIRRPSLVHRRAVPSRAEVAARSSRIRCSRLHRGRGAARRGWSDGASSRIGDVAVGNDLPFVLIAGPCQIESEAHALEMAEALVAICAAGRHSAHLQEQLRQGEPHQRRRGARRRVCPRASPSSPTCASASACRC